MEPTNHTSHEASLQMARNFDIQSKYVLTKDRRTFFDIIKHVVDECSNNLRLNSWIHLSNEGARYWVGSFLMASATEIAKTSVEKIDVTTSKLSVYFAVSISNFFNTDNPKLDFEIVTNLPTYHGSQPDMYIGATLMMGDDVLNWIEKNFEGKFPSHQLEGLIKIYEKYAISSALNNDAKEQYETLMQSLAERYKSMDDWNSDESTEWLIVPNPPKM